MAKRACDVATVLNPGDVKILKRSEPLPEWESWVYNLYESHRDPVYDTYWDKFTVERVKSCGCSIPDNFDIDVWHKNVSNELSKIARFNLKTWPFQFWVERLPEVSHDDFINKFDLLQLMPEWSRQCFEFGGLYLFIRLKSCEGHICEDGIRHLRIRVPSVCNMTDHWSKNVFNEAITYSPYDGGDGISYNFHGFLFRNLL
jgi:hypothetical protein